MGIKKVSAPTTVAPNRSEDPLAMFAAPAPVPTKNVIAPPKVIQRKSENIVDDVANFFNGRILEL